MYTRGSIDALDCWYVGAKREKRLLYGKLWWIADGPQTRPAWAAWPINRDDATIGEVHMLNAHSFDHSQVRMLAVELSQLTWHIRVLGVNHTA
jgi:hypothetical protein